MDEYFTLDGLIEKLVQAKAEGVAGDSVVAYPSQDNNARGGFMQRIESVAVVPVAKADMERGYSLMRVVASRGVNVLVLR